jgi:hypothetical protein
METALSLRSYSVRKKKKQRPLLSLRYGIFVQVARKSGKYFICLSLRQKPTLMGNKTPITTQQQMQIQFYKHFKYTAEKLTALQTAHCVDQNWNLFLLYSKPIIQKILEVMLFLTSFTVYTIYQISKDGQGYI